ncbi:MAG TPA: aminotransferase class V-fold PLP-dependent enzyme [Bryobacteraceae bacterium]|nr:aminotransferase class V-fold PLP-dependent enzyme [Bryobacteraceae bacterium]
MAADWGKIRREFPALERVTFLNTATFGQLPRRAVEAAARHFAHRDETACADFLDWFNDIDKLRASLARLTGAAADDIAFLPNAASGLALLIAGIDWQPGDRILTLEDEFPNNIYAPALLARRGVEFVAAPWERFYEELTPRTRLVALSEVSYSNGRRPPLQEISRRAHAAGALLYVDGTQSLGALRFDVNAIEPDMLSAHGYKWLLSPNGAAFVYVRPSLRARLDPLVVGWRSHRDWRRVDNLHDGAPEFSDSAEKYEGGMLPFAVLYAMQASVDMILGIGPAEIENRVMELAEYARTALRRLGARMPADEQPHFNSPIISAEFEGVDASALARDLKRRGVHVSARQGRLRISTHFYNNEEDVDRLCAALRS